MSDIAGSHKTAASVQSGKSVESTEPAEIIAVTQGETERRMSDLSVPAGASSHGKGRLSARGNWHTRLRVGIMGGTFDPIHNGHLVAASEVAWVYDLDEVIFVPTGRPVFKLDKHVTNAEDRYLMTVIATASNPKFTVSRVDIDRPGVTYTIDTLRDNRRRRRGRNHAVEGRRPHVGPRPLRGRHAPRLLQPGRRDLARRQGRYA